MITISEAIGLCVEWIISMIWGRDDPQDEEADIRESIEAIVRRTAT